MNKIEIIDSYTIIHFDEYPILFIGENYESEIIIGSFIFEDDNENTVKYFHSIVNYNLATKFLKRKLTYLEVLKTASYMCIVTKDYNDKILNIEEKTFVDIDKSFLPLSSALCPEIENRIILKFEGLIGQTLPSTNIITQKYTKQHKTHLTGLLDSYILITNILRKNYSYNSHQLGTPLRNRFVSNSNSNFIGTHKSEKKNL